MATWTTTIGDTLNDSTTSLQWRNISGSIDSALTDANNANVQIDIISLSILGGQVFFSFRTTGGTDEMSAAWENFSSAMVITSGDVSIEVPGPNYSGNASRDTSEPYSAILASDQVATVQAFITAWRALNLTQKRATTVTLRDSVAVDLMPSFGMNTIAEQNYVQDTAITAVTLPQATGGDGTLTYSLSALPAGLSFDDGTRQISGTPTASGTTAMTYTVEDADGDTDTIDFNIVVAASTRDTTPDFGTNTVADQTYPHNVAITALQLPPVASGGNSPIVYSVSTLPAGLSFDANSRQITGTPSEIGETTVTLTATDNDSDTDTLEFDILIEPSINSIPTKVGERIRILLTVGDNQNAGGKNWYDRRSGANIGTLSGDSDIEVAENIDVQRIRFHTATTPDEFRLISDDTGYGDIWGTGNPGENADVYIATVHAENDVMLIDHDQFQNNVVATWDLTTAQSTILDEIEDGEKINIVVAGFAEDTPSFGDTVADQTYTAGSAIDTLQLPVATGGTDPLVYSILPAVGNGLSFDPATRQITGTPTATAAAVEYTYTVTDADNDTDTLTFSITVEADQMPSFGDTVADQTYKEGTAITTLQLPAATGGNAPLTYSISPAVGNGLSFDDGTRRITGTPTAAAAAVTYTYTVEDQDGDTDTLTFSITVAADQTPSFGDTVADQTYPEGTAITTLQLPAATGGDGALTYSISPTVGNGLSFDANTRRITGTPTTRAAAVSYTYTAEDEDGDTDTLTFSITISEADTAPTFSGTVADQTYPAGSAITRLQLPVATGGNGTLIYSISPAVGNGLSFDASTRRITGTPTAQANAVTYTYTVTDADSDTDTLTFSITIGPPDTQPTFGDVEIGNQSYTKDVGIAPLQLPAATGGNGPLLYAIHGQPPGLSINLSRQMVGTPRSTGTYVVTLTAQDTDFDSVRTTFTVTVTEISATTGAINILIEIDIDEDTVLRGGTARMRLHDGTAYYDFQVQKISSLKQTVGSLENPRVVPENASIIIHRRSLEAYDLVGKPIKIINQKSHVAPDRVILFDGFIRSPDGVRLTQDQIFMDIESRFSRTNALIKLKKYNSNAGENFEGAFVPAIFGHFLKQRARLHDSANNGYIVSSLPMRFTGNCVVKVYGDGSEINASNYDVDYQNAQIIFSSARSETEITVDGCGVEYGHVEILRWLLINIIGIPEGEIDAESFSNAGVVPTSRIILSNNTDVFRLISELLFESLQEMTFQNNRAILHSRYAPVDTEIPDSAILRSGDGREKWEEVLNTGRFYANHIYSEVNDTNFEYNDLPEQERLGVISRDLRLKWYDFNTDDIVNRLRAVADNFADPESAIVRATFDRRGIVATPGSIVRVKGGSYYILSRNLSYSEKTQIDCEMWKRPRKSLGGSISQITQIASATPQQVRVEYNFIARTGNTESFDLKFFDSSDDELLTVGSVMDSHRVQTMPGKDIYGVQVSRENLDLFGQTAKFATYDAEVLTATNGPKRVTLQFSVGGNSAGDRTWNALGQKYRVEYKRSSQTWNDAEFQDFEGTSTKAWSVEITGLNESVQYNFRVFRIWSDIYFGLVSNVVNGTPQSATLNRPIVTIAQNVNTLTASWPPVQNAQFYDVENDTGSGYVASDDIESPVTITTSATAGQQYRTRVRARAFGFTPSAWTVATFTPSAVNLNTPTGLTVSAATASEYNARGNFPQRRLPHTSGAWNGGFTIDASPSQEFWHHFSWDGVTGATSYDVRFRVRWTRSGTTRWSDLTTSLSASTRAVLFWYQKPFGNWAFHSIQVYVRARGATASSSEATTVTTSPGYSRTLVQNTVPTFGSSRISNQSFTAGTAITTLQLPRATSGDGTLTYSISPTVGNGLSFNASTRRITGTPTAAARAVTYTYTVEDQDGDRDTLTFSITVSTVVNLTPSFVSGVADKEYRAGSAITNFTLPVATGGDGTLTYSLSALPSGMSYNSSTRVVSGTPRSAGTTGMTYTVTDRDGSQDVLTFSIVVNADLRPTFGAKTISNRTYTAGTAISTLQLPEATGGDGTLTYSISPTVGNGLSFNANTRRITGTPTAQAAAVSYTYTVEDEDGDTDTLTFSINVNAATVDLMPTFGAKTIANQSYTAGTAISTLELPSASGGDGALTYSISPAVGNGLSFEAGTREITGTPTAAASAVSYTYTVEDEDGDTDTLTFSITVNAATVVDRMPTFGSGSVADQTYTAGTAITRLQLPGATGGDGTLTYSISPAVGNGLSFNANTRRITGTPTAQAAAVSYTYTVEDADGDTDTITFSITVNAAAVDLMPTFGSNTVADQTYTDGTAITRLQLPRASGGDGTLTYSISPTLPSGLRFNANNRRITGTPSGSSAKTEYTYTVRDADDDTDTLKFSITVAAQADTTPAFNVNIADQTYMVGTAITRLQLPPATSGNPPLTYSISPTLPNGLSFNANNQRITGTPTAAKAETQYTYTVRDNDGDTTSLTFDITVNAVAAPSAPTGLVLRAATAAEYMNRINYVQIDVTNSEPFADTDGEWYYASFTAPAGATQYDITCSRAFDNGEEPDADEYYSETIIDSIQNTMATEFLIHGSISDTGTDDAGTGIQATGETLISVWAENDIGRSAFATITITADGYRP